MVEAPASQTIRAPQAAAHAATSSDLTLPTADGLQQTAIT